MNIDILINDVRWSDLDAGSLFESFIVAVLDHQGLADWQVEVSVLATNDPEIAALNESFRAKAQPTNVLSWPAKDLAAAQEGELPTKPSADPDGSIPLGDIALSYDTCVREAADMAKPAQDHMCHLVVHGTLHLLGYDHVRDLDATLMQGIETEILGKMGLDDPYRR
ncbi:MAG: rRNA maturation RNase YbeY [Pseudomonadota bacterium]